MQVVLTFDPTRGTLTHVHAISGRTVLVQLEVSPAASLSLTHNGLLVEEPLEDGRHVRHLCDSTGVRRLGRRQVR